MSFHLLLINWLNNSLGGLIFSNIDGEPHVQVGESGTPRPFDSRHFIVKDGVVQDGYTFVYNSSYGTPTFEDGYINTNGTRGFGFDNIDTTGYGKFTMQLVYPNSAPGNYGYFASTTQSLSSINNKNTNGTMIDVSNYSIVNLGYAQGSSGTAYRALIYNVWLEK